MISIIPCYTDNFDFVKEETNSSISYVPVTFLKDKFTANNNEVVIPWVLQL